MPRRHLPAVVVAALLAASSAAMANVKLPAIIGDHMVVQINKPVVVWGWADPGEKVTVTFAGTSGGATADSGGKWMVKLPMVTFPGEPQTMTIAGKNTITLTDILIGEVWVCSGQSNMEMTINSVNNSQQEIAAANYPQIRLITVPKNPQPKPQDDFKGQWKPCTPQNINGFTAAGYFFGRDLHQKLHLPVGLINTSYGGTRAEAWTSREALDKEPVTKPILEAGDKAAAEFDPAKAKAAFEQTLAKWKADAEAAKKAGKEIPRQPRYTDMVLSQNRPANLFNGMVNPIVGFSIRGAIWYQGEANAGQAFKYRTVLPTLINDWRARWGEGDFPFYIVQLANYMAITTDPDESAWAELREAQTIVGKKLPNSGAAVIIDIGEEKDIHPKNKQDVGHRLARLALVKDYGKTDIVIAGPTFKSVKIDGNKAILTFDNAVGLKTTDGQPPKHFAVAGPDKKFVWATAKIVGNTVEVTSDKVQKIASVRYAWANNPQVNLVNADNLPAGPFRTDTWPGITEGR